MSDNYHDDLHTQKIADALGGIEGSIGRIGDAIGELAEANEAIAKALTKLGDNVVYSFSSPNVSDSNFEAANLVDVLNYIANSAAMYLRFVEHEHPGSTGRRTPISTTNGPVLD